jgi:2-methylisocitrate lyase-like PEP mutase family enzyme
VPKEEHGLCQAEEVAENRHFFEPVEAAVQAEREPGLFIFGRECPVADARKRTLARLLIVTYRT